MSFEPNKIHFLPIRAAGETPQTHPLSRFDGFNELPQPEVIAAEVVAYAKRLYMRHMFGACVLRLCGEKHTILGNIHFISCAENIVEASIARGLLQRLSAFEGDDPISKHIGHFLDRVSANFKDEGALAFVVHVNGITKAIQHVAPVKEEDVVLNPATSEVYLSYPSRNWGAVFKNASPLSSDPQ